MDGGENREINHEDVKDKRLEGGGKNVKKLIKTCT
jgi:hypothetical protein